MPRNRFDHVRGGEVAVKVVNARPGFLERARAEAELVSFANAGDPGDRHHLVRLLDCFAHAAGGGRFHRVLVFERLARTLYDLLRDTGFLGVSLPLVRALGPSKRSYSTRLSGILLAM